MRRFLAPALALLAACCLSTAALADTQGTQTVTTSVPENPPSWTLNIPADTAVPYGDPDTSIGWVTVSDVENVPAEKLIVGSASSTDFASGGNTIPLRLLGDFYADGTCYSQHAGVSFYTPFELYAGFAPDRACSAEIFALVDPADWDAAAPGDYEATVTYESYLG